jgi:hypothetical protein
MASQWMMRINMRREEEEEARVGGKHMRDKMSTRRMASQWMMRMIMRRRGKRNVKIVNSLNS